MMLLQNSSATPFLPLPWLGLTLVAAAARRHGFVPAPAAEVRPQAAACFECISRQGFPIAGGCCAVRCSLGCWAPVQVQRTRSLTLMSVTGSHSLCLRILSCLHFQSLVTRQMQEGQVFVRSGGLVVCVMQQGRLAAVGLLSGGLLQARGAQHTGLVCGCLFSCCWCAKARAWESMHRAAAGMQHREKKSSLALCMCFLPYMPVCSTVGRGRLLGHGTGRDAGVGCVGRAAGSVPLCVVLASNCRLKQAGH